MNAVDRATPAIPPTVAPAISPTCDLCCSGRGLEDAVDSGWIVEVVVGVASGES